MGNERKAKRSAQLVYSKNSGFYLDTKIDFFLNNHALIERAKTQNALYKMQPEKVRCKICETPLQNTIDLAQHGVEYKFCRDCGHLNGVHEDTRQFVEQLYIAGGGEDYSKNYIDANFLKRCEDIYFPKIDFLISTIPSADKSILDIGCGSGFFVYCALKRGIKATGIDVGTEMIEYGNDQIDHLMKVRPLGACQESEFSELISSATATIISAIGVIEHLREPHKFFSAFKSSKAQYLYYSVPMFSLSVILENAFPNVFPRQLSGGHTHLFTESSIRRMNDMIGVGSIAEWRFGTDLMDLYRSLYMTLVSNFCSDHLIEHFENGFRSGIDDLQTVLDKRHFCSEIHVLTSKRPFRKD